jgi:hypothetical protein
MKSHISIPYVGDKSGMCLPYKGHEKVWRKFAKSLNCMNGDKYTSRSAFDTVRISCCKLTKIGNDTGTCRTHKVQPFGKYFVWSLIVEVNSFDDAMVYGRLISKATGVRLRPVLDNHSAENVACPGGFCDL